MIDHFLRDASGILCCQFWSIILQCGVRLPMHTLNNRTVQSVVPGSELRVCLSVTLLIVDLWQSCVCCIRSGVTKCTRLMVLYLDRVCQCGLHAVPWSHIGILMLHLTAEPGSTAVPLFFWNDLADPVFDGVGLVGFNSRANDFFIGLRCSVPTIVFYYFLISFLPVYRLVLWGWGLRTDRVHIHIHIYIYIYITLSQPCTADLF